VLMQTSRNQQRGLGRLFKYDVSLPLVKTQELVSILIEQCLLQGYRVRGASAASNPPAHSNLQNIAGNDVLGLFRDHLELDMCCFGHAGDQNLHLNVLMRVLDTLPADVKITPDVIKDVHNHIKVSVFRLVL
jgi:FAD/FMN-containing dehydrogenase